MATTPVGFAAKDNATGQLSAGISAAALSIVLQSGNGANFPQPYNGATTSGGTSTTLNCTGISATIGGSGQAGKIIWNKTDNSFAVITTVSTNSLTTTRLLGGTNQTWNNGDTWVIDGFVATVESVSTSAYGVQSTTAQEEVLVIARSTDTLTVAASGRGYNGTSAASWATNDYVRLDVTAPVHERLKDVIAELAKSNDTNTTNTATNTTDITNFKTGAYDYVVATGSANAYVVATPALAAYAAGNYLEFKANFTNTGAATVNVNSLGAKAIKKNDGATALAANDIINGQIVRVRYDGTNFQMLSPIGTPATLTYYSKIVAQTAVSSTRVGASSTSVVDFDNLTYAIPANDLVANVWYEIEAFGDTNWAAGTLGFFTRVGATTLCQPIQSAPANGDMWYYKSVVCGTAAAGASVAVRSVGTVSDGATTNSKTGNNWQSVNLATNGTLTVKLSTQYSSSDPGNGNLCAFMKITKFSSSVFP